MSCFCGPKFYTHQELREHNRRGGRWVIVHEGVYDLAKFEGRPGTRDLLALAITGKDGIATDDFDRAATNDPLVREQLRRCYKGQISKPSVQAKKTSYREEYSC